MYFRNIPFQRALKFIFSFLYLAVKRCAKKTTKKRTSVIIITIITITIIIPRDMTMVGVERFDKTKLQVADQPKQSLAKSKDMTLVKIYSIQNEKPYDATNLTNTNMSLVNKLSSVEKAQWWWTSVSLRWALRGLTRII